LEWDDAELWLEGAVQNDWSVAQMRVQRWEALGASDEQKPREDDVFVAGIDEDMYSQQTNRIEGRNVEIGAVDALEDFNTPPATVSATEPPKKKELPKKDKAKQTDLDGNVPPTGELLMTLQGITKFPADLAEPLELLKVAILNHKLSGWKSISANQVCQSLETLKMLTVAND